MRVVGMLLIAAVALPTAHAQSVDARLDLRVTGSNELLMPDKDEARFDLVLNVTCPLQQDPSRPWDIRWEVSNVPAYARTVLNPSAHSFTFDPARCTDPTYRIARSSVLTVQTTRDAPAFHEVPITVRATLRQQERFNSTTGVATFTNGYFPLTQAHTANLFLKTAPGSSFAFPIEIINLGNGDTLVTFKAEHAGKVNQTKWTAPEPITLQSRAGIGSSAQHKQAVRLQGVAPPGGIYMNEVHTAFFTVMSRAADPRGGPEDELAITFSIQVQGTGGGADGPGTSLLLLALATASFAARRRTDRTR